MSRARAAVVGLVILAGLPGCRSAGECEAGVAPWVAELALSDPAFGCGTVIDQRVFEAPSSVPGGDPLARRAFREELRGNADAMAVTLVRELVDESLAREVLPFVRSQAGAGLMAAERLGLKLYFMPPDDFFARMAARCSEPDSVGPRAGVQAQELGTTKGISVSPSHLAIVVGSSRVHPEDSPEIAAFIATDAARRWLDVRSRALTESQERFMATRRTAAARGLVTSSLERDLDDLVLPRAEFQDGGDGSGGT